MRLLLKVTKVTTEHQKWHKRRQKQFIHSKLYLVQQLNLCWQIRQTDLIKYWWRQVALCIYIHFTRPQPTVRLTDKDLKPIQLEEVKSIPPQTCKQTKIFSKWVFFCMRNFRKKACTLYSGLITTTLNQMKYYLHVVNFVEKLLHSQKAFTN